MTQKRKIYYLLLLFFSTFLISGCRQSTSNNFQFSSSITPTESSKPYFKLTTANNTAIMTMEATASNVTATKNETTYKNIAPHTDVIYKKIENGIKEEIILSEAPNTPPIYKFTLDFGNLKPQYFEGQYYFFDSEGYARFTIPRPFMVDAAGVKSEAVNLKINNNLSTVTPDYGWLSDPQRKYPVTIDPTIVTPDFPLRELADQRTISAKTYDLGGGKFASTSGLEAIHYQDASGKWLEKDTTIVPSSDPEYNYMNTTNNFQTFFSTDGFGQKKAVKFQVKDSWMKFKIINASGSGRKNETEDNKFEFKEISKNGDKTMAAAYTLEADRLLEEVVLNKFQGFPEIKQEIELHNTVLRPDGKKINAYHSTTNELLWVIPEPVMYELNRPESRNYGLHYEISCQNSDCSNLILTKVIDPEGEAWLSDPNQNYPLVIDTTAGPNSPGTMADDATVGTAMWQNPNNSQVSDNVYSTITGLAGTSHYLKATNFGFSIPAGATITGILAEVERKGSGPGTEWLTDNSVKIVKANGSIGTTEKADTATIWPITDTYASYGYSSDLWGETWATIDINDVDFGIVVSAKDNFPDFGRSPYIDHIRITVYYTDPTPTPAPGMRFEGVKMQGVRLNGPPPTAVPIQYSSTKSPGTMADDASIGTWAWTNPGNATISDNVYATHNSALSHTASHYLKATNFGFSIPAGATINGVIVEVEVKGQDDWYFGYVYDNIVKLVNSGIISGDNKAKVQIDHWPTSDTYRLYGLSSDLWGLALTYSDINATTFGMVISKNDAPQDGAPEGFVDHIQITVYYTN